jgi:FkbM family methyltransferase
MKIRTYLSRVKRRLLKRAYIKDKHYPAYWFHEVIGNRKAQIVQIGSNDGKTGDPLHELLYKNVKWRALFVEPVKYSFDKLKTNYEGDSRFQFENVAINNGEKMKFYYVDPDAKKEFPDLPYWYDQLGSFNREHILNQLNGKLSNFVKQMEIEGLSLGALLNRNKIEQLDILHIDTEGYDWKILSQLDLKKFVPYFILMEYNHLSKSELDQANFFLKDNYTVFNVGIDLLAVNNTVDKMVVEKMKNYMKLFHFDRPTNN